MAKTNFVIQVHRIGRSNKVHWDLRIQNPRNDQLWSWAIPKQKMPQSGNKILAIKQSDHPPSFLDLEGTRIAKGGRRDRYEIYDKGKVDLLSAGNDRMFVEFYGSRITGKYMFIDIDDTSNQDNWLIIFKK